MRASVDRGPREGQLQAAVLVVQSVYATEDVVALAAALMHEADSELEHTRPEIGARRRVQHESPPSRGHAPAPLDDDADFLAFVPSAPPTVSAPVTSIATKTRKALRNMRLLSIEGSTLYLVFMDVKLPPWAGRRRPVVLW